MKDFLRVTASLPLVVAALLFFTLTALLLFFADAISGHDYSKDLLG